MQTVDGACRKEEPGAEVNPEQHGDFVAAQNDAATQCGMGQAFLYWLNSLAHLFLWVSSSTIALPIASPTFM